MSDGSSMVLLDANRSLADVRVVYEQYGDVKMLMDPSTIDQNNFSRNIPEFNINTKLNKYLSCGDNMFSRLANFGIDAVTCF